MKGFSGIIVSCIIFATVVNGLITPPNSHKIRQTRPISVQQLEAQISQLQQMLKELQTLEYKQHRQKPLTTPYSRRNRFVKLIHPQNFQHTYQPTRPYDYYYYPQDMKKNKNAYHQPWHPYYPTYLRTPHHLRYQI